VLFRSAVLELRKKMFGRIAALACVQAEDLLWKGRLGIARHMFSGSGVSERGIIAAVKFGMRWRCRILDKRASKSCTAEFNFASKIPEKIIVAESLPFTPRAISFTPENRDINRSYDKENSLLHRRTKRPSPRPANFLKDSTTTMRQISGFRHTPNYSQRAVPLDLSRSHTPVYVKNIPTRNEEPSPSAHSPYPQLDLLLPPETTEIETRLNHFALLKQRYENDKAELLEVCKKFNSAILGNSQLVVDSLIEQEEVLLKRVESYESRDVEMNMWTIQNCTF